MEVYAAGESETAGLAFVRSERCARRLWRSRVGVGGGDVVPEDVHGEPRVGREVREKAPGQGGTARPLVTAKNLLFRRCQEGLVWLTVIGGPWAQETS